MTEIPLHYLLAGARLRTHSNNRSFHGRLYIVKAHVWVSSSYIHRYLFIENDYAGVNGGVFGRGHSPVEYYD